VRSSGFPNSGSDFHAAVAPSLSKARISVSRTYSSSRRWKRFTDADTGTGDLSRYFGGEVDISSVVAHSLEWNENAGHLSKIPIDETKIKPENRIPRVTSATWFVQSLHNNASPYVLTYCAGAQEIRERCGGEYDARCCAAGDQL
jgi:hypothetical protein